MKTQKVLPNPLLLVSIGLFFSLFTGCAQNAGPCPIQTYSDLSEAENFVQDDRLPFQFPLNDPDPHRTEYFTQFCTASNGPESARKYHAAEDYFQPAGTPVYAMADGEVSFSGPMGGYGWLIIIDHPQANIYSLYGHLSTSRWLMKEGPVAKGELIAYLGDSHENGGTLENPLEPHLHLGIRTGQRGDYPGNGEWRWQAGWIHSCPTDLGWLHPSVIIVGQSIPDGGYPEPPVAFLSRWGIELLFGLIYFSGAIGVFISATRKNKPLLLVVAGAIFLIAGWIFYKDGWRISTMLLTLAVPLLFLGIKRFAHRN